MQVLATLAFGLVGDSGANAAAQAGKTTVENNYLTGDGYDIEDYGPITVITKIVMILTVMAIKGPVAREGVKVLTIVS